MFRRHDGSAALQRVLADIAAGRVDTVVVCKIDRLTRSLADFAKIVKILEVKALDQVGQEGALTCCELLPVRGEIA